jgi:hypothetical protein
MNEDKDALLKVADGDPLTEQELRNVCLIEGDVPDVVQVLAGEWIREGYLWSFFEHWPPRPRHD